MFATDIGSGLTWLAGTGTETIAQWVGSLNAEDYGGYNDWSVATGAGTDAPNTTTNQLGELFQTDCGNAARSVLGCSSFSSLEAALNANRAGALGSQLFYSSSLSSATCCNIYTTSWWAYISEPAPIGSYQAPWNYDTALEGRLENADAIAVRNAWSAPELDPTLLTSAATLLLGGLAIRSGRRRLSADAN
jgi:hypothetical protein